MVNSAKQKTQIGSGYQPALNATGRSHAEIPPSRLKFPEVPDWKNGRRQNDRLRDFTRLANRQTPVEVIGKRSLRLKKLAER